MLKFGSKHDSNIVYKCTVRLLEDTEILECEYKVFKKILARFETDPMFQHFSLTTRGSTYWNMCVSN